MTLDWLDEAKQELIEASVYYQLQEFGLGDSFVEHIEAAVGKMLKDQMRHREFDPPCRKVIPSRFPYQIVFMIREKTVVLVAVMHQHRDPGYWRDRIES